jgi:hypothetical protein
MTAKVINFNYGCVYGIGDKLAVAIELALLHDVLST